MKRYAIYYAPPPGAFAQAGAAWLGWDAAAGADAPQPDPALMAVTVAPRKYGFHGTLKPPFRLAPGQAASDLSAAVADLAQRLAPVTLPGLQLRHLDRFLALTPEGDEAPLRALAAEVVLALERFRAPLNPAEIAKRRPERLSPRQRALLDLYGYPFVMEEFRFHLTLSDRLAEPQPVAAWAEAHFAPHLPRPFTVDALCLFGEAEDGRFHLLERHPLTASVST